MGFGWSTEKTPTGQSFESVADSEEELSIGGAFGPHYPHLPGPAREPWSAQMEPSGAPNLRESSGTPDGDAHALDQALEMPCRREGVPSLPAVMCRRESGRGEIRR